MQRTPGRADLVTAGSGGVTVGAPIPLAQGLLLIKENMAASLKQTQAQRLDDVSEPLPIRDLDDTTRGRDQAQLAPPQEPLTSCEPDEPSRVRSPCDEKRRELRELDEPSRDRGPSQTATSEETLAHRELDDNSRARGPRADEHGPVTFDEASRTSAGDSRSVFGEASRIQGHGPVTFEESSRTSVGDTHSVLGEASRGRRHDLENASPDRFGSGRATAEQLKPLFRKGRWRSERRFPAVEATTSADEQRLKRRGRSRPLRLSAPEFEPGGFEARWECLTGAQSRSVCEDCSPALTTGRTIYYLDVCCGAGGFSYAARMLNGVGGDRWVGLAGVDFCETMREHWEQNFPQPFFCNDITNPYEEDAIVGRFTQVTLGFLSGPCQPYCRAGRRRRGDSRVDVMRCGVRIYIRIHPPCIVLENVDNFEKCAWEPVWEEELRPQLEAAGYHVTVLRSNAKHGLVPENRLRCWIVCTLYRRTGLAEGAMEIQRQEPEVRLVDWYPEMTYVRFRPCHGAKGVIDARKQAHPCFVTHCVRDVNLDTVRRHRRDPVHPREAQFLTVEQRKEISTLPVSFSLPPMGRKCRRTKCCGAKKHHEQLLGVTLGNLVIPLQALIVLRSLQIPDELKGEPLAGKKLEEIERAESDLDNDPVKTLVREYVASLDLQRTIVDRSAENDAYDSHHSKALNEREGSVMRHPTILGRYAEGSKKVAKAKRVAHVTWKAWYYPLTELPRTPWSEDVVERARMAIVHSKMGRPPPRL